MCKEKVCKFDKETAPPKLGFLSDPLPSGPGGGHSHARSEPHPDLSQAPLSWPKGDFIDFVDFAVFLRILGQSSKCARNKYANLIRKMHPPKLGF